MLIDIGLPNLSTRWKHILFALLLSLVIIFSIIKRFRETTVLTILIFAFLIYLIITADTGDNLAGSLPSTTYPIPPHLGLDGNPF